MKIYKVLWLLFAVAVGMTWLLGQLDGVAIVASGMVAFGMIYFGMMLVLPFGISHPRAVEETDSLTVKLPKLGQLHDRWTTPDIAMGKLNYR